MTREYVNFGFPDTTVAPLGGFDLTELSPITGILREIKIDSDSEFMEISCRINELRILPLVPPGITIRTHVPYPINKKVTMDDRLVVELDNHDPFNPHTPSISWEIEEVSPKLRKV